MAINCSITQRSQAKYYSVVIKSILESDDYKNFLENKQNKDNPDYTEKEVKGLDMTKLVRDGYKKLIDNGFSPIKSLEYSQITPTAVEIGFRMKGTGSSYTEYLNENNAISTMYKFKSGFESLDNVVTTLRFTDEEAGDREFKNKLKQLQEKVDRKREHYNRKRFVGNKNHDIGQRRVSVKGTTGSQALILREMDESSQEKVYEKEKEKSKGLNGQATIPEFSKWKEENKNKSFGEKKESLDFYYDFISEFKDEFTLAGEDADKTVIGNHTGFGMKVSNLSEIFSDDLKNLNEKDKEYIARTESYRSENLSSSVRAMVTDSVGNVLYFTRNNGEYKVSKKEDPLSKPVYFRISNVSYSEKKGIYVINEHMSKLESTSSDTYNDSYFGVTTLVEAGSLMAGVTISEFKSWNKEGGEYKHAYDRIIKEAEAKQQSDLKFIHDAEENAKKGIRTEVSISSISKGVVPMNYNHPTKSSDVDFDNSDIDWNPKISLLTSPDGKISGVTYIRTDQGRQIPVSRNNFTSKQIERTIKLLFTDTIVNDKGKVLEAEERYSLLEQYVFLHKDGIAFYATENGGFSVTAERKTLYTKKNSKDEGSYSKDMTTDEAAKIVRGVMTKREVSKEGLTSDRYNTVYATVNFNNKTKYVKQFEISRGKITTEEDLSWSEFVKQNSTLPVQVNLDNTVKYLNGYISFKGRAKSKVEEVKKEKSARLKKKTSPLSIGETNAADSKAKSKASVSNKFIGFGEGLVSGKGVKSSTFKYGESISQSNPEAVNSDEYNSNDVVFVSVPGKRGNEKIALERRRETIALAEKALDQGATIIADNEEYIFRDGGDYNIGEQIMFEQLRDSKKYDYSEETINGDVVGVWNKKTSASTEAKIEASPSAAIKEKKVILKEKNKVVSKKKKRGRKSKSEKEISEIEEVMEEVTPEVQYNEEFDLALEERDIQEKIELIENEERENTLEAEVLSFFKSNSLKNTPEVRKDLTDPKPSWFSKRIGKNSVSQMTIDEAVVYIKSNISVSVSESDIKESIIDMTQLTKEEANNLYSGSKELTELKRDLKEVKEKIANFEDKNDPLSGCKK